MDSKSFLFKKKNWNELWPFGSEHRTKMKIASWNNDVLHAVLPEDLPLQHEKGCVLCSIPKDITLHLLCPKCFRLVRATGEKRRIRAASWQMRTSCPVPRWCRSTWLVASLTLSLQVVGTERWCKLRWRSGRIAHLDWWATVMPKLLKMAAVLVWRRNFSPLWHG